MLFLLIRQTISIHASAREATSLDDHSCIGEGFQSTPPRGRRQKFVKIFSCPI